MDKIGWFPVRFRAYVTKRLKFSLINVTIDPPAMAMQTVNETLLVTEEGHRFVIKTFFGQQILWLVSVEYSKWNKRSFSSL